MTIRLLGTMCMIMALIGVPALSSDDLQNVLNRMNQFAPKFQGMTANVKFLTHTDVINENVSESGTIAMRKEKSGLQALIDFTEPPASRRTISFSGRIVRIYIPKINTVQVIDLGKGGQEIEQFVMIGFGTSGTELANAFTVQALGAEQLNGQATVKLNVIPKSETAKRYVSKVELWIPQQGAPEPVQEKVYEPDGDYRIANYTNIRNTPPAKEALKLKMPPGVKVENIQK